MACVTGSYIHLGTSSNDQSKRSSVGCLWSRGISSRATGTIFKRLSSRNSGASSTGPMLEIPFICPSSTRFRSESVASDGSTARSEEHTSELQSLMRISYAVFCLKKKKIQHQHNYSNTR